MWFPIYSPTVLVVFLWAQTSNAMSAQSLKVFTHHTAIFWSFYWWVPRKPGNEHWCGKALYQDNLQACHITAGSLRSQSQGWSSNWKTSLFSSHMSTSTQSSTAICLSSSEPWTLGVTAFWRCSPTHCSPCLPIIYHMYHLKHNKTLFWRVHWCSRLDSSFPHAALNFYICAA